MINNNEITGFVLAGGKSSRMGHDKGLVEFNGKPMVMHSVNKLNEVCQNVFINANNPEYNNFGHDVIPDVLPDIGPLGGLFSCLFFSKAKYNIFLPCDMPLISVDILKALARFKNLAPIGMPVHENGYIEPLISLFDKEVVNSIIKLIITGSYRVDELLNYNPFYLIPLQEIFSSEDNWQFHNVNSKEELQVHELLS